MHSFAKNLHDLTVVAAESTIIYVESCSNFTKYALAAAIFALACLFRFALISLESGPSFVTFFPAVALTALLCGFWPSFLVLVASGTVGQLHFMPPFEGFGLPKEQIGRFATFFVAALVVCLLVNRMHSMRRTLLAALAAHRIGEERLRLAQEAAGIGLWDWDIPTGAVRWSVDTARLHGFPEGTVEVTYEIWRQAVHPEDRDRAHAAAVASVTNRMFEIEYRVVLPDGQIRWLAGRGKVIFDAAGQAVRMIGINLDITERHTAADALATANAELGRRVEERTAQLVQAQKMEALGQLTGGIAHDINNLLQGIGSCLAALERHVPAGEPRRLYEAAQQGIERGARLTQSLLAFARRQTLAPKTIDLGELLDELRPLLERTLSGLIRIEFAVASDTAPALVDPAQLEAAILNLAINARDAMPLGGRLTVRAANATVARPYEPGLPLDLRLGEYVVLSVEDTGAGMSQATLARVFEPFFTTKEVGKGSGLGLPMVHGMVTQSGGGMHITSTLGKGTTVSLYLPRAMSEPSKEMQPSGSGKAEGGNGRIVLLVDDDALVRIGTEAVLTSLGYRVLTADSGAAAMQVLRGGAAVDVLVTDYAMPGMTGVALVQEARNLVPGLPVLLMTGYAETPDGVEEVMLLQKPFRPELLIAHLATVIHAPAV